MLSYIAAFGCIIMALPAVLFGAVAASTGKAQISNSMFKKLNTSNQPTQSPVSQLKRILKSTTNQTSSAKM